MIVLDGTNGITTPSETVNSDATIHGLTVGLGGGGVSNNTALGANALQSNTTGNYNTASGVNTLYSNTTGYQNNAFGNDALFSNTTGVNNTANGYAALYLNTTGSSNTAVGNGALQTNTTASNNTAVGFQAGYNNTTGAGNAFHGMQSFYSNSSGNFNTSIGYQSLFGNSTGSGNIGIRGTNSSGVFSPAFNITTQNNYAYFGSSSLTNAYIQVSWTVVSDKRDKTNIGTVPLGLDFVNQLKPVSYQFKTSRDDETPNGRKRYGFLAQDIAELETEPVIIDHSDPEKLRFNEQDLVAVLVNAVKELSTELTQLKAEIAELKGAK